MSLFKKSLLFISLLIIAVEITLLVTFYDEVAQWVSHNWWIVIIPFIKMAIKKIVALNLISLLQSLLFLAWHVCKLLLLKLFKSIGLRYGLFFSQYRWRWIRKAKILFLRRGKQFFRRVSAFFSRYSGWQKAIILIAFFPIGLVLFLLGLSFNVTRKTIVQKTQEAAIIKAAESASNKSRGIRFLINRIDLGVLEKIKRFNKPKE